MVQPDQCDSIHGVANPAEIARIVAAENIIACSSSSIAAGLGAWQLHQRQLDKAAMQCEFGDAWLTREDLGWGIAADSRHCGEIGV